MGLMGGLTAIGSLALAAYLLFRMRKSLVKQVMAELQKEGFFSQIVQNMQIEDQLINSKLDNLILKIKSKIPMVAMFLSGELENTLKSLAKEELASFIPEVKELLLANLQKNNTLELQVGNAFSKFKWKRLSSKLFYIALISALFGVILGLISALFLSL